MTEHQIEDIAIKSFSIWAVENQFRHLQEELAELIAATNRYLRKKDAESQKQFEEELADAYIMISKIKFFVEQHESMGSEFRKILADKLKVLQDYLNHEKDVRNWGYQ